MEFYPQTYYHLYNRTNNRELLFKEKENCLYFLRKYRKRFRKKIKTIAYCLMPTHFHFLIYNEDQDSKTLSKEIGTWLSAYAKAINKRYQRNGSLFQRHTKAIPVTEETYMITLLTYIHQNPLRSKLVTHMEDWRYSSYLDFIGYRYGTLIDTSYIKNWFQDIDKFKIFSESLIEEIDERFWV